MPVVFASTPAAITPMTTTTIPAANNFFFRLSKTNARITAPIASAINPEELLLPTSATMQKSLQPQLQDDATSFSPQ